MRRKARGRCVRKHLCDDDASLEASRFRKLGQVFHPFALWGNTDHAVMYFNAGGKRRRGGRAVRKFGVVRVMRRLPIAVPAVFLACAEHKLAAFVELAGLRLLFTEAVAYHKDDVLDLCIGFNALIRCNFVRINGDCLIIVILLAAGHCRASGQLKAVILT